MAQKPKTKGKVIAGMVLNALVRYNVQHKKWTQVTSMRDATPLEVFDAGIMEDVTFSSTREMKGGCRSINVGVAEGTLKINRCGKCNVFERHMSYNPNTGDFIDEETRQPIKKAERIRLMPNRKALYVPCEKGGAK